MINILEKITELREQRHWSEYTLAEKSGLTQSTISSWYRKGILPTITSLSKICDAFDISLSQFFQEDEDTNIILNERQKTLLKASDKFNSEQYQSLISFIEKL